MTFLLESGPCECSWPKKWYSTVSGSKLLEIGHFHFWSFETLVV